MTFGETNVAKEEFDGIKKSTKIWDVDVPHIFILKLIKWRIFLSMWFDV